MVRQERVGQEHVGVRGVVVGGPVLVTVTYPPTESTSAGRLWNGRSIDADTLRRLSYTRRARVDVELALVAHDGSLPIVRLRVMTAAVSAARASSQPAAVRALVCGFLTHDVRPRTFTELRTAGIGSRVMSSRLVSPSPTANGASLTRLTPMRLTSSVYIPGPGSRMSYPPPSLLKTWTTTESRGSSTTSSTPSTGAFVARSVTRPRITCAPTGSLDASVSAVPNARAATLALFPLQSDMRAPPKPSPNSHSSALYGSYCPFTFAHVSLSVTVRLNTRRSGRESTVSLMKYPVRSN